MVMMMMTFLVHPRFLVLPRKLNKLANNFQDQEYSVPRPQQILLIHRLKMIQIHINLCLGLGQMILLETEILLGLQGLYDFLDGSLWRSHNNET